MPRLQFVIAMAKVFADLTYTNFKSHIEDHDRGSLYMGIWSKMQGAQRSGVLDGTYVRPAFSYADPDFGYTGSWHSRPTNPAQSVLFEDIHEGPAVGDFTDPEPDDFKDSEPDDYGDFAGLDCIDELIAHFAPDTAS